MNFVPHIPAPFTVVDLLIKLAVMDIFMDSSKFICDRECQRDRIPKTTVIVDLT